MLVSMCSTSTQYASQQGTMHAAQLRFSFASAVTACCQALAVRLQLDPAQDSGLSRQVSSLPVSSVTALSTAVLGEAGCKAGRFSGFTELLVLCVM